eukprot:TRINITY_DN30140_c0_g1_i1.p1 TRINITY_DN30140_c0_g1~~TRINITY_DN30140_c0_g1_i1.p1  ORF type:complete len:112 (+),score=28.47 TRINITY_DN30140_c0_g1_i1:40-375(+)
MLYIYFNVLFFVFFFFKQKTAYEMLRSLVGSEMCIRDRHCTTPSLGGHVLGRSHGHQGRYRVPLAPFVVAAHACCCLLYTSDAADEEDSVDLGGRRIIKKKKKTKQRKRDS